MKPDFHHLFPTECFDEHRANIKYIITGTNTDIPQHERMIHVVVRDHMTNVEFLKKYGRYVQYMRIHCKGINKYEPTVYQEINDHCPNLKEIEFYDMEGQEFNKFNRNFAKIESVRFKSGIIGENTALAFKRHFSNVAKLEFVSHVFVRDTNVINGQLHNLKEIDVHLGWLQFHESDIQKTLQLNKDHLRRLTLRGEVTPMLMRFVNDTIPQLEQLSLSTWTGSSFIQSKR